MSPGNDVFRGNTFPEPVMQQPLFEKERNQRQNFLPNDQHPFGLFQYF